MRFPAHGILGEETGSTPGGRYTWYLDPIDGTKSFISGMPLFGTLIALADERDATVIAGMIDMPALAERWYGTSRGTTFNEAPAKVSQAVNLEEAQIYTSSPDFFSPEDWARYDVLSRKAMFRRFAAIATNTACWPRDTANLVVETSLKSFDFMALRSRDRGRRRGNERLEGLPLTRHSDGRVIAAANKTLLEQALAIPGIRAFVNFCERPFRRCGASSASRESYITSRARIYFHRPYF